MHRQPENVMRPPPSGRGMKIVFIGKLLCSNLNLREVTVTPLGARLRHSLFSYNRTVRFFFIIIIVGSQFNWTWMRSDVVLIPDSCWKADL